MQRHYFSTSLEARNLDCAPNSPFLCSLNTRLPLPAPCPAPAGSPALSAPSGLFAGGRGTWGLLWSVSLPSVLGCKEADISHPGSPHPSPKKGALLKDYTQRLGRPGFPGWHAEGAGPPGQAVCRLFSSQQSVLPQFPDKTPPNGSSCASTRLEVTMSGLGQGSWGTFSSRQWALGGGGL